MVRAVSWALLLSLAAPAAAGDLGRALTFGGRLSPGAFRVGPGPARTPAVLFQTQASDPVADAFDAFLLQGVSPDAGVVLQVQRRIPGGVWEPWKTVQVKRFPGGRFWGRASFGASAAGTVRLRALNGGVAASHSVDLYTLEVYSDGEPVRDAWTPPELPRAPAEAKRPVVVDRAAWGARPPKEPFTPHQPLRLAQHHTAGRRPDSDEEDLAEMRFLQDFHMNGRGWNDIGYHFIVSPSGTIFEGRPEGVVGAHVRGGNTGNVGISLMGFYHPPYDQRPSAEQLEAVRALGAYLRDRYGISPDEYRGHRDYGSTDCPGDRVYELLGSIREAIRGSVPAVAAVRAALERLGLAAALTPTALPSLGRGPAPRPAPRR